MKNGLNTLAVFCIPLSLIMVACIMLMGDVRDQNKSYHKNVDELISLARKNGMARYKLSLITLYPNSNTDKIDSVYNESLKKDSVQ